MLEKCEGNLRKFCQNREKLPNSLIQSIMVQVASAVHVLHQNQIAHCDQTLPSGDEYFFRFGGLPLLTLSVSLSSRLFSLAVV